MLLSALLLLQSAAPAAACPATPVIPAELAGWSDKELVSVSTVRESRMPVGHRAELLLLASSMVKLAAPVTTATPPKGPSGVLNFTVPAAGRYRVALGNRAWIDVVRNGKALASVAHDHGPACSPVKKTVDFDLGPGAYKLQIVGSAAAILDVMIARLH